jgi:hypothetical protein
LNAEAATNLFRKLDAAAQVKLLTSFGHELTIIARDTYEAGTEEVLEPQRLRRINEIQHRVFGHIDKLLNADSERYPDDVLMSILLTHQDSTLQTQAQGAFERAAFCVTLTT